MSQGSSRLPGFEDVSVAQFREGLRAYVYGPVDRGMSRGRYEDAARRVCGALVRGELSAGQVAKLRACVDAGGWPS